MLGFIMRSFSVSDDSDQQESEGLSAQAPEFHTTPLRETLRAAPELAKKLAALEKKLTGRLDVHEAAIVHVLQRIMKILDPPPVPSRPPQPRIGFSP